MPARPKSTYYLIGQLSPEYLCVRFNPGEIHLKNGWVVDIYQSGICIWKAGVRGKFALIRPSVRDTMDDIVTMFNFVTDWRYGLKADVRNWLEARDVVSKSNMIGWIVSSKAKIEPSVRSRDSAIWRRVGRYYERVSGSFYHRLALRDYKTCMTNRLSNDAFFYAYRIVEDIRKAVTQHLADRLDTVEYWREMHRILGTRESDIKPLTRISTKVRHGAVLSKAVKAAGKKRERFINIGIEIMRKEFRRSFKGLLGGR